jgi:hypothetical protein
MFPDQHFEERQDAEQRQKVYTINSAMSSPGDQMSFRSRVIRLFGPAGFVLVLRSNEEDGVDVTDSPVSEDKVALLPR